MPLPKYQFFSPSDAARMSRLSFMARQVVEGIITGLHKSPHRGFSVEFSEHREYVPGDELRHLDWKTYARSDRYYIKLYEQETNLRATIVLDTSNSMQFANKLDYGRHLAACITYLLAHQQDLAGLCTIDQQINVEIPPASSPAHLDRLFKELELVQAGRETNLADGLHQLSERLPRRSLVILISDVWFDLDTFTRALQHLRYRHHQGLVIHLISDDELNLPYDRQLTFEDLETGEKLQLNAADIRETYKQQVQDYLTMVRKICSDTDVEYHPLNTKEAYDKALVQLIHRRS
jgi:uncharacterized protein (DUF58 family)